MKKQYSTSFVIIVMLISSAVTSSAFAANPGGYFGISGGTAEVDILNEEDSGLKIFGGANASENFGYEIAFVDLGDFLGGAYEQYALAFDLVGYIPLTENFDIFGKAGLFFWGAEFGPLTDSGSDFTYGFGLNFGLSDKVSVRAEWENFSDISGSDVSLVSAGLTFNF